MSDPFRGGVRVRLIVLYLPVFSLQETKRIISTFVFFMFYMVRYVEKTTFTLV